jgi:protocatechuate 3,4-dioxygenase beta subunit
VPDAVVSVLRKPCRHASRPDLERRAGEVSPARLPATSTAVVVALVAHVLLTAPLSAAAPQSAGSREELPRKALRYAENRILLERVRARLPERSIVAPFLTFELRRGESPIPDALLLVGTERRPLAVTDPAGCVRIPLDSPERLLWFQTPDDRHLVVVLPETRLAVDRTVVLLPPPIAVRGRVRDGRTGQPLLGAIVWPAGEPWHATESDDQGLFTVATWDWGPEAPLRAGAPGYLTVDERASVRAGGPVEIRLRPAANLIGRVVDDQGAPVPEARIELFPAGATNPAGPTEALARSETGSDGGFSVRHLAAGASVDLRASHLHHPDAWLRGLTIAVGAPPVEVTLAPSIRLSGRVVDREGTPISGAAVTGRLETDAGGRGSGERREGPREAKATSGEDGAFELHFSAAGHVALEAAAVGYQPTERRALAIGVGRAEEEVLLTLDAAASLDGRVLRPDGRSAAGALVTVIYDPRAGLAHTVRSVPAGEAGLFSLDDLAPGSVSILADLQGFRGAGRRFDLDPGANRVRLQLERGLDLHGRVLDDAGAPVAGVHLTVEGPPPLPVRSTGQCGLDGGFRLSGLAPGFHELTAERAGYAPVRIELEIGNEPPAPLTVRMRRGADLRGRLLGVRPEELAGGPAGGVDIEVAALGPSGAAVTGSAKIEGGELAYLVRGLAPGTWTAIASTAGGARQARATVVVSPGDRDLAADLDLGAGYWLTGTVRLGGAPLPGAQIELVGLADQGAADGVTGANGRFELSGLADGPHQLAVVDDRATILYQELIDLNGNRTLEVDIDASAVAGTVRDPQGRPLPGVLVTLTPTAAPDGGSIRAITDPEGRFLVPRVPAGSYKVAVSDQGRKLLSAEMYLQGGGSVEELTLDVPDLGSR